MRWNNPGLPHKGWTIVATHDLGDLAGACDMCGTAYRYAHLMRHETQIECNVGCVCAEKMANDYVTPRAEERKLKNKANRTRSWFDKKWLPHRDGTSIYKYRPHPTSYNFNDGLHYGIKTTSNCYRPYIEGDEFDTTCFSDIFEAKKYLLAKLVKKHNFEP